MTGFSESMQTDGLCDLLPMIRWQGLSADHRQSAPAHQLAIVPFEFGCHAKTLDTEYVEV